MQFPVQSTVDMNVMTLRLYAEELLQPEKVSHETVVPQRSQRVAQPRPAPSKRAPAPAQQLPAARYVNFHHGPPNGQHTNGGVNGGVPSPPRDMEHMQDHLTGLHMQEEDWHDIDPEMVRTPPEPSAASGRALVQATSLLIAQDAQPSRICVPLAFPAL